MKGSSAYGRLGKHLTVGLLAFCGSVAAQAEAFSTWFERFKSEATDQALYQFLYRMPKGGDLHHHLSGSAYAEWWYELALAEAKNGYHYYTKTSIQNCLAPDEQRPFYNPYYLLYRNITSQEFEQLTACERSEYTALNNLTTAQKAAWLNSLRLDKPLEGREEFFEKHWQRLNALFRNPYLLAEILYKNMAAFAAEGLLYLETQVAVEGMQKPDGTMFTADAVADIYRERISRKDAKATGVRVRFQLAILRFTRAAEEDLRRSYQFVHNNQDLWVAVNMVGREDNDKGHPLRFLPVLRELRKHYSGVKLAIHAGEVDEPNHHVRDTLLLGADRIGHGLNLITDSDTLLLFRHGPYLVEINLISNLLLEYIDDYAQHPFPEYLRTGVPVALSTDDRGMWDSQITDEFFVAVKEFDLSWEELQLLHRNSLQYSFLPAEEKQTLLQKLQNATENFMQQEMKKHKETPNLSLEGNFLCRYYQVCMSEQ